MLYCAHTVYVMQSNNIAEKLDLVDLEFSDMTIPESADAGQRSWAKR
jgi:hypothetical protein